MIRSFNHACDQSHFEAECNILFVIDGSCPVLHEKDLIDLMTVNYLLKLFYRSQVRSFIVLRNIIGLGQITDHIHAHTVMSDKAQHLLVHLF